MKSKTLREDRTAAENPVRHETENFPLKMRSAQGLPAPELL